MAYVPDSPFCGSEECHRKYSAAASQTVSRRQVFDRDLGICRACNFNAQAFFQQIKALPNEQARYQALMGSRYRIKVGDAMLSDPKEGMFWEADHIIAVAEGGGESDLSGYQTLCTPCHAKKTAEQAQRAAQREKEKKNAEHAKDMAPLACYWQQ